MLLFRNGKILNRLQNFSTVRRMFIQKTNPITGRVEWVDVQSPRDEMMDQKSVIKNLLSNSLYLDMLNDHHRNASYYAALQKTLIPGQKVLDIGTGSGLLALMTSKILKQTTGQLQNPVVACESFLPMASLARELIRLNDAKDDIEVINARSDDLSLEQHGKSFDVIVTEIFDSELLGEGLLPTLRHALQHLVKDGGVVIPAKAVVYCQLVESSLMRLWKEEDLSSGWMHSLQEHHLSSLYPEKLKPISKPISILQFDMKTPPNSNNTYTYEVEALDEGEVDGVVVWWDLFLDQKDEICLSTRPDWIQPLDPKQQWRQHWKECWAGVGSFPVHRSDLIQIRAHHEDLNINLGVMPSSNVQADHFWKHYTSSISSRRLWELRSQDRSQHFEILLDKILESIHQQNTSSLSRVQILLLGEDSIFTELLKAKHLEKKLDIVSVQESVPGFKRASLAAQHWPSNLNSSFKAELLSQFLNQSIPKTESRRYDCVLAEPYFWSKENQEPWKHYVFFKQCIQKIKTLDLLSEQCLIYPNGCQLYGIGAYLPDLSRTRQPLEKIQEWDFSQLNHPLGALGQCPSFPLSIWQAGRIFKQITRPVRLQTDDLDSDGVFLLESHVVSLTVEDSGTCDCLLVYPKYNFSGMQMEPSSTFKNSNVIPEPTYEVYGICLFPNPILVTESAFRLRVSYDTEYLTIQVDSV